jgi:hypothetical protein
MTLVNGYVCRNCADVELAKRGIDPAHPQKPFRGSEAFAEPATEKLGENRPNGSGVVGTRLNVLA